VYDHETFFTWTNVVDLLTLPNLAFCTHIKAISRQTLAMQKTDGNRKQNKNKTNIDHGRGQNKEQG
jgi:hypothetical protein